MKRIKELPLELAEKMALPAEVLPGTGTVTVSGGRQACVEGHRGILEYSEQRVVLAMKRGRLSISGAALRLRAMNGGELVISGRIENVEWS